MSSNTLAETFDDTCVPIDYPCQVGSRYIDPCDCTRFYQCQTGGISMVHLSCPPGTGYDHTDSTSYCRELAGLVLGEDKKCKQLEPWDRCEDDHNDVDEDALQLRCANITSSLTTLSPQGQQGQDNDSGDGNGAAIAGAVIAVLLVAVIIVLLVVYIRKRGNPIQHIKESQFWKSTIRKEGRGDNRDNTKQTVHRYGDTPTAFPSEEETYAEIEDTAVYKDSAVGRTSVNHTLSHTNQIYDREDETDVVTYDNRAFKKDTPPPSPSPPFYPAAPPPYTEQMGGTNKSGSVSSDHQDKRTSEPVTGEDGYLMAGPLSQSQQGAGSVEL